MGKIPIHTPPRIICILELYRGSGESRRYQFEKHRENDRAPWQAGGALF
jgi:hypothetical protein